LWQFRQEVLREFYSVIQIWCTTCILQWRDNYCMYIQVFHLR